MMMIMEDFLPSVECYELELIGGHQTSKKVNLGIDDDDCGLLLAIRLVIKESKGTTAKKK
jgi:hypothetical protein